jgi:signal transduction histidine kinase
MTSHVILLPRASFVGVGGGERRVLCLPPPAGVGAPRRYVLDGAAVLELQQVLVNLIVNAVHAMPRGGTLTLSTRDEGEDGVAIGVADSGTGLTDELLARLFQPFVTRHADGTGLGLWISRGLVERYGGDIAAANRPEGGTGAVFRVALKANRGG